MLHEFIAKNDHPFIQELRRSCRNIDIEERFDLLFSRPLGLLCAWLAMKLVLKPVHVSLLAMLTGVASGILLYWRDHFTLAVWASGLLLLSGVLDSADGQLARLTGKQSQWGRIVDGIMDNIVFQFVFWGGSLSLLSVYGPWVIGLGCLSGGLFSVQALIFDFYKNEFSFYGGNHNDRNPTAEDVEGTLRTLHDRALRLYTRLHLGYVRRYRFLVTRTGSIKIAFETAYRTAKDQEMFCQQYKAIYGPYITWWALFGGMNTHRLLIVAAALLGRLDIFFIANILLTIPMGIITVCQARRDQAFLQAFRDTQPPTETIR
jgi:hypothetical protein